MEAKKMKMDVKEYSLDDIEEGDYNIRTDMKDKEMSSLMNSMQNEGQYQPIGLEVHPTKVNKYKIIFGHRRFNGAKKLGWKKIQAYLLEAGITEEQVIIMNMNENLQRKDNSITEIGRTMHLLHSKFGLSESEIAVRMTKPVSFVKSCMNIYNLPDEFKKKIVNMGAGKAYKNGYIPASLANRILQMDRSYRIGKVNMSFLLKKVMSEDEFGGEKISKIMALIKEGMTVEEAYKYIEYIQIVRINVPLFKKEVDKYTNKKLPVHRLLKDIIFGKSKIKFTKPKGEK